MAKKELKDYIIAQGDTPAVCPDAETEIGHAWVETQLGNIGKDELHDVHWYFDNIERLTRMVQKADAQLYDDALEMSLIPIREFAREHFSDYGRTITGCLEDWDCPGDIIQFIAPSPHTPFYTTCGQRRNPKDSPATKPIPEEVEVNGVSFTRQEVNIMLRVSNSQV